MFAPEAFRATISLKYFIETEFGASETDSMEHNGCEIHKRVHLYIMQIIYQCIHQTAKSCTETQTCRKYQQHTDMQR